MAFISLSFNRLWKLFHLTVLDNKKAFHVSYYNNQILDDIKFQIMSLILYQCMA